MLPGSGLSPRSPSDSPKQPHDDVSVDLLCCLVNLFGIFMDALL